MGTIKSTQKSQRSRSLDIRVYLVRATQGIDHGSEHSFDEGLTLLKINRHRSRFAARQAAIFMLPNRRTDPINRLTPTLRNTD